MSLGSKELFHSNFLEFLWDINRSAFINMINKLSGSASMNLNPQQYELKRENKNFDICIYHKSNSKIIYDLVLENKVKSIPYKEQLQGYVKKVENNQNIKQNKCSFLLLTLSDSFPDMQFVNNPWKIITYKELSDEIKNFNSQIINSSQITQYINDYCKFIDNLEPLKSKLLPSGINSNEVLFKGTDIDNLKTIRLHDLYIKLRSSWFLMTLKKHLEDYFNLFPIVVHKYVANSGKGIYLNVDMFNATGQIAALIADGHGNTFEIVIQGDQYRHGINQHGIGTNTGNKYQRLNELFERLNKFKKAQYFLNSFPQLSTSNGVQPQKNNNFRGSNKICKKGPFDCIGEDCIYRYIKVDKVPIKDLISEMANDINTLYNNIPKLK